MKLSLALALLAIAGIASAQYVPPSGGGGATGPTGPVGPTGATGATGATGSGTPAPTFSSGALSTAVPTPADLWRMNEGSGNTFADSSGTANTVTAGGTVIWSSGAGPGACATGCAHFPGTYSSASANHTTFNPTASSAFSLSVWASFDTLGNMEILASQLSTGTNSPGWYLRKNDSNGSFPNEIQMVLQDSAGGRVLVSWYPPPVAGTLYHYVVTVSGSHTAAGVALWVNGIRAGVHTPGGIITDNMNGSMTSNANIYIASADPVVASTLRHVGYEASLRIYNRVLTQEEIQALYAAGPLKETYNQATRTTTTVTASSFATLDADCATGAKIGGGTATDNTSNLNAVLATASASAPLELIMDGCSVVTGLKMSQAGYTTIRGTGWGSGLFVKSGSNSPAIDNGYSFYPTGTAPTRGANVVIRDLRIHANRGTYPSGNSTVTDARGNFISALAISSVENLLIQNVWIYDAPTYAFIGANLGHANFIGNRVEAVAAGQVNTDGFHIDGPANNLKFVANSFVNLGDDSIALNAPEGYGGAISDVSIEGVQLENCIDVLRAYTSAVSGTRYVVKNISVTNVTGDASTTGFILAGAVSTTAADWIENLTVSNLRLASPRLISVGPDSIGDIRISNSVWIPTGANDAFLYLTGATTINNIELDQFTIYRNATGSSAARIITIPSGATVNRLAVNGFSLVDALGRADAAVPYLIESQSGGTLGRLWVGSLDPDGATAVLGSSGSANVTKIQGPGVTAAGLTAK